MRTKHGPDNLAAVVITGVFLEGPRAGSCLCGSLALSSKRKHHRETALLLSATQHFWLDVFIFSKVVSNFASLCTTFEAVFRNALLCVNLHSSS